MISARARYFMYAWPEHGPSLLHLLGHNICKDGVAAGAFVTSKMDLSEQRCQTVRAKLMRIITNDRRIGNE